MTVNLQKLIRTMKILLIVLITIGISGGAVIALYLKNIRDNPTKSFGGNANFVFTDDSGVSHEYNQGIISFLIVGLDSNEEREQARKGYRSDVMMVCVVDTDNNQASLVSIPRDTKARVQVLNTEGKPTRMVTTKINSSFSYGFSPDKFGYKNTLDAVNELLNSTGVKIDPITTYIGADMDDFVHIANMFGGVSLQLPYDVPGFGSGGEWIHLEGEKALDYVCIRKGKGLTGSDTDRTERQRGFIKGLAARIQELGGLATLPKLYTECINKGYLDTNFTIEQIYALSASIEEIDLDEVVFEMVPGSFDSSTGISYWEVNKTQLKTMVLDLFYNAQQGNGMPTAKSTLELTTTNKNNTESRYNYTSRSKAKTTKKSTTKKTTDNTTKKATTTKADTVDKPTTSSKTTEGTTTSQATTTEKVVENSQE